MIVLVIDQHGATKYPEDHIQQHALFVCTPQVNADLLLGFNCFYYNLYQLPYLMS